MWRGASKVGEVLELAGIQLVSTSCSMGQAGRASVCLFLALTPLGLHSLLLLFLLGRALPLCVSLSLGFSLGLGLFLRWSGRGNRSRDRWARGHYDLVLALSVGNDCTQQQSDDRHEIKVPLWAQKLVQVHLRNHLLQLPEVKHGERMWTKKHRH